ncbi:hypothetical protein ACFQZC_07780 [Streptacidiphilus monticola]
MSDTPASDASAASAASGTSGLKKGAIGLGGAVVMSAALMGPAVSVYFNPQLVAAQAGRPRRSSSCSRWWPR